MKWMSYILVLALTLAACANPKLQPLDVAQKTIDPILVEAKTAKAQIEFCTLDAEKVKSKLKFIFILDKSGSNQSVRGGPGTDADGTRRYVPLLSFLNDPNTSTDESIEYSLINFSTGDALHTKVVKDFTSDVDDFGSVVQSELDADGAFSPIDEGWTDYVAALNLAKNLIEADVSRAKENQDEIVASNYVVLFISDGAPIIGLDVSQDPPEPIVRTREEILDSITAMQSFELSEPQYVSNIQLHAGYYFTGAANADAENLMKEMAKQGKGEYYAFGNGQGIDFSRFSVPERNIKHSLDDVFVRNASAIWDGTLEKDTDRDGLSDKKEEEIGSSANKKDSDENGIGDYVEFHLTNKPCKDAACAPAEAASYQICNEFLLNSAPIKYSDRDRDGLNDCEEELLKSQKELADSNGDFIPDILALFSGIGFIQDQVDAWVDPDLDNMSNYSEIKHHTPVSTHNDDLENLKKYKYSLKFTRTEDTKNCYDLEVDSILVLSENDSIQVHILESTSVVDNRKFYRFAEKPIKNGIVSFRDKDFESE